ncbi:MAG: hypothetical protein C5S44_10720 [Candidatus Methanocomedens sp.]|nr:MAG: hypothetical protein C5S44_10720 [ANME-2 cluster archaeon]
MNGVRNRAGMRRTLSFSAFTAVLVLSALAGYMLPVAADENGDNGDDFSDLLLPNYVFSTNYYDSFGTPDIYASLLGDPEFERGETVQLKVNIVNKGAIYGFKYDTSVGTDKDDYLLSMKELEYEMRRTTAVGIKVEMISGTPYIEVKPDTSIRTMESLFPGKIPEHPLTFTITISNKAPAGAYYLQLPVSYQYQSQVRITTNNVVRLGLTGMDHISHYNSANKTLLIPIYVKASPKFEVTGISGNLVVGETQTIDVTYKNTGELTAEDATVRMVVMRPLSIGQSVVRLGTMAPGESRTARFNILADSDAVIKTYGIDSEIKYYDEQGEITISDNLEVSVPLEIAERKIGAFELAFAGVIILLIFIIVNVLRNLKKYE